MKSKESRFQPKNIALVGALAAIVSALGAIVASQAENNPMVFTLIPIQLLLLVAIGVLVGIGLRGSRN